MSYKLQVTSYNCANRHIITSSHHLIFVLLFCFSAFLQLKAQPIYQLPNNGFETWYKETTNAGSIVPTNFNSFYSAYTTLLTQMGVAQRCDSSRDVRAGATGTFSLMMYSNSVLGVRANGNVTTGRMFMGSTTAIHVDNHNRTVLDLSPPKHYQEITGTPDSMKFWVKYLPGRGASSNPPTPPSVPNTQDKGRIRAYIHGTGECRDAPVYPTGKVETDYYYGKAMKEFYKENGGWQFYQVPFEYTGNNTTKNANGNYYVLVSMTTSFTPGGGADNPDYVWFDDIEFVYSAWLNDLKVNGVTIENFNKFVLEYSGPPLTGSAPYAFPYLPANFSYVVESPRAQVTSVTNVPGPTGDANKGYTSILVTANDGSTKEYKIHYGTNFSSDNTITGLSYTLDNINPITILGVNPSITNYSVTLQNPDEWRLPKIRPEDVQLSHPAASVYSISQPNTIDNSQAIVTVRAENFTFKTYTVSFAKPVSTNKNLSTLKIAGVDVPNFHPDTLEYNYIVTACVTANSNFPTVTYQTESIWSTVGYVPATTDTKTATITVTAQNGGVKIYKVNFIYGNDNATLLGYRVNTTNQNNVFSATNFTHTYTASLTATPTLSLSSTAAQQPCQGSTVAFPSTIVWYPDTNKINVTAQNGVTKLQYGSIIKNTNCYLLQTSGNNVGLKYLYNGVVRNITVPSSTNNNDVTINVTIPVAGPNEPCVLVDATTQAPVVDTVIYTQPEFRTGSGRVKVVANDGVANKTYIINFTPTISTDATLSKITYDGLPIPGFSPTTSVYTLIFPSTTTEVPEIDYLPSFQWLPEANMVYTPAATLADTAYIEVTAENGTAKRTYKIAFEVVAKEKDAYLIDIKYNNQSIDGFNPTVYEYLNVEVPYSNPTPPVTVPVASSNTAIVLGSEQLTTPPYTKHYFVYSEDLSVTKIYKIEFVRVKNTNAALADIKINGVSIPDFNAETFDYQYELPYTTLTAPVVTATPAYPSSSVEIIQIDTVIGIVTINITAEDNAFTEVYTIDFARELSPVKNIETLTYEYDNEFYTFTFPTNETEVTINLPMETLETPFITDVLLADNRSTFEIAEQPEETNDLTGIIVVTAEDATDETYTITFERTPSSSTLLTGIYVDDTLISNFNPAVLNYSIMLPFDHSVIPNITATAAWQGTNVTTQNPSNPFGTGSVTVTSEDGNQTATYTIVFQRKGNAHLSDLYYTLDGEEFTIPDFHQETFTYDVLLPYCTEAVPVLVYLPEDNRCSIEYVAQNTPNGTSSVTLVTWNQDATLTYTVNFTVNLSTDALLSDIKINGVPIPNFNPNTFNYPIPEYVYGTPEPVVTATAQYCDAKVTITQSGSFPGTIIYTIEVIAGNLSTNTYTISCSMEAGNNTYLLDLLLDGVHWWEFDKNIYYYERTMPYGTTVFPEVTGIPEDPRSEVDHEVLEDGKKVIITVTAINGDVAVYQFVFFVRGNDNAFAKMLYVDWKPLKDFDQYVHNYTYYLPDGYTGVPDVMAEMEDENATYKIKIDLTTTPPHTKVITLAEDESSSIEYRIHWIFPNAVIVYDNEPEILVYPNPSSGIIHFEVTKIEQGYLEIYSMEGKKVHTSNLQDGVNTINIENLQKGIYFYKIFTENTMIGAGKFVKK